MPVLYADEESSFQKQKKRPEGQILMQEETGYGSFSCGVRQRLITGGGQGREAGISLRDYLSECFFRLRTTSPAAPREASRAWNPGRRAEAVLTDFAVAADFSVSAAGF